MSKNNRFQFEKHRFLQKVFIFPIVSIFPKIINIFQKLSIFYPKNIVLFFEKYYKISYFLYQISLKKNFFFKEIELLYIIENFLSKIFLKLKIREIREIVCIFLENCQFSAFSAKNSFKMSIFGRKSQFSAENTIFFEHFSVKFN